MDAERTGFFGAPFLDDVDEIAPGDVVFVGVPCEVTGKQDGTRFGPAAVRMASRQLSSRWATDDGVFDPRFDAFVRLRPGIRWWDTGELNLGWHDVVAIGDRITEATERIHRRGGLPVAVGGDHFLSFPSVRGLIDSGRIQRLGYVQIDAHLDFDDREEGEPLCHGTHARRTSELEGVAVEDMAWLAVEDTHAPHTWQLARSVGAACVTVEEMRRRGMEAVARDTLELLGERCDGIYVSIDIDAVQAGDAPATTYTNLLGLTARELFQLLRELSATPLLVGIDLCEVTPTRDLGVRFDRSGKTAKLGAWALSEILGDRIRDTKAEPFPDSEGSAPPSSPRDDT